MNDTPYILYVEDDTNLGFVVQDRLKREGYTVHLCRDGKSALQQFNERNYGLCVLDVMLPQKDGFSLAEDIRKLDAKVPILFLTARERIEDKSRGFAAGGDDYLTKPFEHEELVMRIAALLKRSGQMMERPEEMVYRLGEIEFQPKERALNNLSGEPRRLTKTEAAVLELLCKKQGEVVERSFLLNSVWGTDDAYKGRSLDVYISKLRKYLSEQESVQIENLHGTGFRLLVN